MRSPSKVSAKKFLGNEKGNVAILFGLMSVPLVAMTGASIDYSRAHHAATTLQGVADAAAIAGARLPATKDEIRFAAASANLDVNLTKTGLANVATDISASNAEVKVEALYTMPTVIMGLIGQETINVRVVAAARAQVENGGVACLISLSPDSDDALHLQGINQSSSENCWNWANSTHPDAINGVGSAQATAQGFCTAGGVSGPEHFSPPPYTGCEPMDDPFEEQFSLDYPSSATCDHTNVSLKKGTHTLYPGVYCGGITLRAHADVTFKPGNYVINDGELDVQAGASAEGVDVTFFFVGDGTRIHIHGGADAEFTAPTTGDYAGFLFVDRADSWETTINESIIEGGGRINLQGVVYAPKWKFNVSGNGVMNQDSQFFAAVTDTVYMEGNGKFYIRSDATAAGYSDDLMPKIKTGPMLTL